MLAGPGAQSKAQRQLYTNDWQIKASARMMALFFAANSNRPKIELSEFYNTLVCSFNPLYVFVLFFSGQDSACSPYTLYVSPLLSLCSWRTEVNGRWTIAI